MKKLVILSLVSVSLFLSSCKKIVPGYTSDDYSFDATLPVVNINAGDTAVFYLTENPDVISFFSGELGHEYINRDRTVLLGGRLNVKFETRIQNQPADSIDVLISNDFSGIYDSASVANATWKLMSGLFNFPDSSAALSVFYPSGPTSADFADFADSVIPGQPFYFAYRYRHNTPTNIIWSIGKLGMYNVFSNGVPSATVIDSGRITSGGFVSVAINDSVSRWSTSSTYLKCTNSSLGPIGAEHWYISKPLNPSAVAPDLPLVIKNITQSPLTSYKYVYSTPGTYKAVFIAKYVRLNFEKTFVKEITVNVQ